MNAMWIILIAVGGLLALGLLVLLLSRKGPDLGAYLPLAEPRLSRMADERVLEVAFSGPADTVIKQAYGILFKAYFGAKGSPKGPAMRPPKARYAIPIEEPGVEKRLKEFNANSWSGSVAIPFPSGLEAPEPGPGPGRGPGMAARIATWKYGEVAEILHRGPYETEPPTIERLTDFVEARGYRIIGDHEEEYLRGPGMAFVRPKDYWTIIRFRVEKAG